ncbi:MAG: helix-turn-helix domain-containing protein [Spirosomaceae bacterium]|jgi:transcriptional regulator with XRE-family HTH domain|nr:helix-turn-helix domain-containing protein [Spirosomataceae bacterium]
MNIGENIQHLRVAKGLLQADMAEKIGMDKSTYSRIEKKGNKIDFEEILKISKALDVTVYELISATKDDKTQQLESRLSEVENELQQTEREKSLIITNCLDFINSSVEHKFCNSYQKLFGQKKVFEDLVYTELQQIYENDLCNDYTVFFALKKGLVANASLNNIHKNYLNYIDDQIKSNNKKFSDFIRINNFLP